MGIRLRLLSLHLPKALLSSELERVLLETKQGLDSLIREHCDEKIPDRPAGPGGPETRREEMARAHRERVDLLVGCLGEERAVELGRERMFRVGLELGREARRRLGVGDSLEDALRAARILYRVLGIEFSFSGDEGGGLMTVHRCALSPCYDATTCRIMSAADAGVLRGLNPRLRLEFETTIPSGSRVCRAKVLIEPES